jgi:hypothetical protein
MRRRCVLAGLALVLTQRPLLGVAQVPSSIAGEWVGSYACAQGWTGLHLTIKAKADGNLAAIFSFGALPSNPGVPSGRFQMNGTFDPKLEHLVLSPAEWISQPAGYMTVGLDGTLDCSATRLKGTVTNGFLCSTFTLSRASGSPDKAAPCTANPADISLR